MDYYLITAVVTNSYFYFQACFTDPLHQSKLMFQLKKKKMVAYFTINNTAAN